jgi:hypothetical protein
LAGAAGPIGGFEAPGGQGLLASASNGSLAGAGQAGFAQDGAQYAAYGNAGGQVSGEQQGGFVYQQAAYSNVSTAEGQQYAGKFVLYRTMDTFNTKDHNFLGDQQQQQQQQGFEQQGQGFVQNVQYQSIPQYGVSG